MLQQMGLSVGESPVICNLLRPDWVQTVHRRYIEAGCDVILTNTFVGSRPALELTGYGERVRDLNRRGARLAKEIVHAFPSRKVYIAASIGPTGLFIEPIGDVTAGEMESIFREQIEAVVEEGIDLICIETMSDLGETTAALRAARSVCDLPVIATLTFEPGQNGLRTMMGVTPGDAVRELIAEGADVVGSNCGRGIDEVIEVIREMRGSAQDTPLAAKPNAGLPELVEGRAVYRTSSEEMASRVEAMIDAGASLIGGCCGTTPEHLERIAKVVKKRV
jgi:5-methyltetrahydrofolate--homocysteine methyltransferase